jgi:hypothetical protein
MGGVCLPMRERMGGRRKQGSRVVAGGSLPVSVYRSGQESALSLVCEVWCRVETTARS